LRSIGEPLQLLVHARLVRFFKIQFVQSEPQDEVIQLARMNLGNHLPRLIQPLLRDKIVDHVPEINVHVRPLGNC